MSEKIKASELILNENGSVYHLHLKPENIAKDIVFVGDPDRVEKITKHFDSIEFAIQKREFKTVTGFYKNKRITVISTGIGPDNIDIVLNELDALVNVDLANRTVKNTHTTLNIYRIGTSGAIQKNIPIDSFVISSHGLDVNGMLQSYQTETISNTSFEEEFVTHTNWHQHKARPILIEGSKKLIEKFSSNKTQKGITITAGGFYAPQGRSIRLPLQDDLLNAKIESFSYQEKQITNLEMETSAIYGLSKLMGHNAISLNAILANRGLGTFSNQSKKTVEKLINYSLEKIVS